MATGLNKYREMYTSAGGPQAGGGGNPFAALMASMGGGGQSVGAPAQASPAPAGGAFSGFLDPSGSGIGALIGRLTGAPTREEWLFKRAGEGAQRGMAGLTQRLQTMSPQQAVMDFIGSPEGMEFFTTVPNASDEIKKQLGLLVPEVKDNVIMSPGQEMVSPDGSEVLHGTPTTEVQDFTGLAKLSNLPNATIEKLAAARLAAKQTGDLTQTQQATAELEALGQIDHITKLKIDGGLLTFEPVLDPSGRTVGHILMDKSDPQNPRVISPAQGSTTLPASPGEPSYAPGVNDDGYDPEASAEPGIYLKEFQNPADIVEGAGLTAMVGDTAGGLMGEIIPGMSGAGRQYALMRRGLNQIRNDARVLKDGDRILKDDLKVLDSLIPITTDATINSYMAAEALMKYNEWLDQRIQMAQAAAVDPATTGEVRGKALLELKELGKAKANVPPNEALAAKLKELEARPGSPFTRGVKEGAANVGKAVGVVEQGYEQGSLEPVPQGQEPKFATPNDAQDAFYKGIIKLGQWINVGGKRYLVKQPQADNRGKQ